MSRTLDDIFNALERLTTATKALKPDTATGRDFSVELAAARLGLPVQQQTLCKLLGISGKTFSCWEQAGCPKIQIKDEGQPQGYVRYDLQAVREWIQKFEGTVPEFTAEAHGRLKSMRAKQQMGRRSLVAVTKTKGPGHE